MDDQGHAHGIWHGHGRMGGYFFFIFFSFPFCPSSCWLLPSIYAVLLLRGFGSGQHHCITSMALG
jgi:hypothetical protein